VLRQHSELRIETISVVEVKEREPLPAATDTLEWQRYNSFNLSGEHYDLLEESEFAKSSPALERFIAARNLEKPLGDPLTALRHLNGLIHDSFEYESGVTQVHSPIAQALDAGRGVCQDFTHIMIAITRRWAVPARYVSGYLYHRRQDKDRSSPDETHAWMEAYLPSLGWVGFDPTNNIVVTDRHVRVAVGRDYADVPPTRGTFKGNVESELGVAVRVESTSAPTRHEEFLRVSKPMSAPNKPAPTPAQSYYQQQQ